jgi:DNA polymerase-4
LQSDAAVKSELEHLAAMVHASLRKKERHGKTIVLKARDVDFNTQTKRISREGYFDEEDDIMAAAWQLWEQMGRLQRPMRLLGITATALAPQSFSNVDLPLWERHEDD